MASQNKTVLGVLQNLDLRVYEALRWCEVTILTDGGETIEAFATGRIKSRLVSDFTLGHPIGSTIAPAVNPLGDQAWQMLSLERLDERLNQPAPKASKK